jgi:hypothetical protein
MNLLMKEMSHIQITDFSHLLFHLSKFCVIKSVYYDITKGGHHAVNESL